MVKFFVTAEDNLKKTVIKVKKTDSVTHPATLLNIVTSECSDMGLCEDLKAPCLDCKFNFSCIYGSRVNVTCTPLNNKIKCEGKKEFIKEMTCSYCYQTPHWDHICTLKADCNTVTAPKTYYRTNCTVKDNILCLGKRTFNKNLLCNWTRGYKWSTAVLLSITLGGFGADRFYLGHWQEGIGKLFSFGGLGVWTLIDVILICLRYLGPADGSLYI